MPKIRKRYAIPIGLLLAGVVGWFGVPWLVDLPEGLGGVDASPVLLDRHGEALHHLTLPDFTRSSPVDLESIPVELIDCTIAAEDKRFFDHGGIDLLATARAGRDWLRRGEAVSGASTITQQLVKLSSPPQPRTIRTKIHEALVARRLEMSLEKDRILESYLNRLDYGRLRLGPVEAARFYFQKPVAQLSLGECALLAGLPQAPSRLNPLEHPDRALRRREVVLDRLAAGGKYDESRISAARSEPLRLRPLAEEPVAPWLPEMVGGNVRTTLDANLQRGIETIVAEELEPLRDSNLRHIAVVVIDNPSGGILALVSSGDWNDPRGGRINGALAPRSPGSALKPFTYLMSFQNGRHPGSIIADIPTRFRTRQGLDAPENFDRSFQGPVTIRHALACSLNVPAMRELNRLGGSPPLSRLLAKLGVAIAPEADAGLGLTIGGAPVRLIDLTNAYATLARGGSHASVVLDPDREVEWERVFGETEAWLVADILADPTARAPAFGRGGPMELPFPCAAKTGTSSDFRDNWCLGFTARFTVGVWAGNFDNTPLKGLSGVAGAGPVFQRTMRALHEAREPEWPDRPAELVEVRIDPRSGKAVGPGAKHSVLEWVPQGAEPEPAAAADYDGAGRLYLDSSYAEWLESDFNRRRDEFAPRPELPVESPLRILAPRPGAVYVLDPELPNGGRLHLATNLPGLVEWSCETLELRDGDPEPAVLLKSGRHVLRATDPRSGETREIEIVVEEG
ncbi:transglycosylase domain-containing protein [Haloferula sp. A504]|uniref:transglycosylase domain-containing protein n=1 Tax=Haloferula sp. A504 TaxID=3373601 RepID=UPI0031C88684|nr:transglycosylase domain-containing protein [Verrucomicrobiaceae bacterium E54]